MTQKVDPFISSNWGWDDGESGWGAGMNENLIQFSFLHNRTIDDVVGVLPPSPADGEAYFLTADNLVYFRAEGSWYSTVLPKGIELQHKTLDRKYIFDGTDLLTTNRSFSTRLQLEIELLYLKEGDVVETRGCDTEGDGGHGVFDVVDTTPLSVDDYAVISDGVRYAVLRGINGEFNPLQFGAVADGVTDDTDAIRRANTFMKERGGGILNFLDREYSVTRASTSGESGANPDDYIILVDYSNITFKGVYGKAKIVHDISDTDFTFARVGVLPIVNGSVQLSDVVFDGLEIDGGYTPVFDAPDGGHALLIAYGVERFQFKNLYLHNSKDYGIGLQNGGHVDGLIENVLIEDTGADGIDHKNNGDTSRGNVMNNVTVRRFGRHASPSDPYAGIDLMFGWQVSNLNIEEFGAGGDVGAGLRLKQGQVGESRGAGAHSTNGNNINVYAIETFGSGTTFEGVKCSARNCNFTNIITEGCSGSGVLVEQRKNKFSNVRSVGNAYAGILTRDSAYTTNGDNCQFTNVEADANDTYGFRIETNDVLVNGGSADANDINFSVASGSSNVKFVNVANQNAVTKPVENTGSTTTQIVDCPGFVTDNFVESATFSVTVATTVTVTVDHGIPFDFPEVYASVCVRRSSNNVPWTMTRLLLVSISSTQATYQVTIGTASGTGGDTATLLCRFNPRYIASSI